MTQGPPNGGSDGRTDDHVLPGEHPDENGVADDAPEQGPRAAQGPMGSGDRPGFPGAAEGTGMGQAED
ncbi:hypothetical protein GCM10027261_24510 [Geodermatophilus arenarius]|uniref:Uncharacterized protein n=1 Tax=Geodermatophilus arenarius TaxID=1137990 RepID=A0ABV9LKY7_9ACTN